MRPLAWLCPLARGKVPSRDVRRGAPASAATLVNIAGEDVSRVHPSRQPGRVELVEPTAEGRANHGHCARTGQPTGMSWWGDFSHVCQDDNELGEEGVGRAEWANVQVTEIMEVSSGRV